VTDSGTDARFIKELREAGLQVIVSETGSLSAKAVNHKHSNKKH
jgi:hypothetical protein